MIHKLPKYKKKKIFATAHGSLGNCYKKSAGAIEFSTQKLAKIS